MSRTPGSRPPTRGGPGKAFSEQERRTTRVCYWAYAAILLEMGAFPFEADFARDLSQLVALRRSIASWLDAAGINPETRNDIVLATHEAVANAMEHAQQGGPIEVRGKIEGDAVTISVANVGGWRPPTSNELRGRGLAVIRALMSNVEVEVGSNVSVVMHRSIGA